MRIPFWIYKLGTHSPDWSGWRVKYVSFTFRARIWDCEKQECHECPSNYHFARGDTPISRWKEGL